MKRHLKLPRSLAACAVVPALIAGLLSGSARAQSNLVPWDQTWNYMHPTAGALPAGSGATEPNPGATKWYAPQAEFDASYTGPSFAAGGAGYEAGSGIGPLGYAALNYFTVVDAEFTSLGTTLTTPGTRYTAYFRTTFTVPADGNFYVNPVFRYIYDDGGFVYLDGELVLRVNMPAAATDSYTALASSTTNTEENIRSADLSLPAGSTTGEGPTFPGNATVVKRVTSLAPGTHTLAVSIHNAANTSTDLSNATNLLATATSCGIVASAGDITRSINGTPADPADDTVSFTVNVAPTGTVGANWTITSPPSLSTVTGPYSSDVPINDVPISAFPPETFSAPSAPGILSIAFADVSTPGCTSVLPFTPPHIIASDDSAGANAPVLTTGLIPNTGWAYDDSARTMRMNNGGGGLRKVVTSRVLDLSAVGAVQFTGVLEVIDDSTGTEAPDSFVAYLDIDGTRVNLITESDTQTADGVLADNELAPAGGTFLRNMSHTIPESANSVQIIIEGINDSENETLLVRDLKIGAATPGISTQAGTAVINNQATDSAADDTFSAPVTITALNLGLSPGWTSDASPAAGLYADPQPVTFGNFAVSAGPRNVTLTDSLNLAATSTFTLTPPEPAITLSAPANIVIHENGAGTADDTVTFDFTISGANGGPGWTTATPGVTPTVGNFGIVTFTITAPLPANPLTVTIADVSYPGTTQTVSVAFGRYIIGQKNLGSGLQDLSTSLTSLPDPLWVNNATARTLTMNTGAATDSVVTSEVIDLSATGEVSFTGNLNMTETSDGSNLEVGDRFKAELVIDAGLPTQMIVNLVDAWDIGDGDNATVAPGTNGAKNGYINGYSGTVGTDQLTNTVYGVAEDEYNANRGRDEWNTDNEIADTRINNDFALSYMIPASANNVQLKIYGANISGTETATVSNVLFNSTPVAGDADGDGMTDTYEDANGLDKNSAADKNLDLDGDAQSNYHEFLAGTGANNAASTLKIVNTTRNGNEVSVTWNSVPGRVYRIFISPNLTNWTDLGQDFPASAGTTTTAGPIDTTGLGNPPKYFLRVTLK